MFDSSANQKMLFRSSKPPLAQIAEHGFKAEHGERLKFDVGDFSHGFPSH